MNLILALLVIATFATDSFFRVTESNSVGVALSAVDVYLISIRILV